MMGFLTGSGCFTGICGYSTRIFCDPLNMCIMCSEHHLVGRQEEHVKNPTAIIAMGHFGETFQRSGLTDDGHRNVVVVTGKDAVCIMVPRSYLSFTLIICIFGTLAVQSIGHCEDGRPVHCCLCHSWSGAWSNRHCCHCSATWQEKFHH